MVLIYNNYHFIMPLSLEDVARAVPVHDVGYSFREVPVSIKQSSKKASCDFVRLEVSAEDLNPPEDVPLLPSMIDSIESQL